MTQVGRRFTYIVAGVVPASIAFLDRPSFKDPPVLSVLAGLLGLCLATAVTFPVAGKKYWGTMAFLVPGLCVALPWLVLLLFATVASGFSGGVSAIDLTVFWCLIGPSGVAIHFIARSRGAPNTSLGRTRGR